MATSGFLFKFLNRTKKKVPNIEGDRSLEDIEASIKQRDGEPTVVGAVQSVHLKIGEGKRTNGIVGAKPGADKITVEYFGLGYARSDMLRFLLHKNKVEYEFIGYDFEQWGAMKGSGQSGEFGGLPRVCINGKEFGQSMASLRMLGAKYGMYDPKDWKSSFYTDHILDAWVDIHDKTNGIVLSQDSEEVK